VTGPESETCFAPPRFLQFVQGSLSAQLGSRWAVRFASNYDVESGTVIENRFEVDFREQCWAVTVALVDRTDEDEFRVTISLLELGQYALGRALGRSAATP
jgi:hypothetical protein